MLLKEYFRFLQGPEAQACLECLRNSREAIRAGWGKAMGRVVWGDFREEFGVRILGSHSKDFESFFNYHHHVLL